MVMYFTYCYGAFFFLSWMPSYLANGRGFVERDLRFSTLPFILGRSPTSAAATPAIGSSASWASSGAAVRSVSSASAARRSSPSPPFSASNRYVGLVFLALSYAGSDFMLSTAWAVCLDVGRRSRAPSPAP